MTEHSRRGPRLIKSVTSSVLLSSTSPIGVRAARFDLARYRVRGVVARMQQPMLTNTDWQAFFNRSRSSDAAVLP